MEKFLKFDLMERREGQPKCVIMAEQTEHKEKDEQLKNHDMIGKIHTI
jgi:hypothetical protein